MRAPERRALALRMRGVGVLLLLGFGVLGTRAAHLALFDPRGAERGTDQIDTVVRLRGARGAILDRAGTHLAVAGDAPSVFAVPREIGDAARSARRLARALGRPAAEIEAQLRRASGFRYVARWVSEAQARAVQALDLPGIGVLREPRRAYPHAALAGALLGFTNIDGEGVRGIERQEDAWLRGRELELPAERDARRRLLATGGLAPARAAGGDIALSLDVSQQAAAEGALADAVAATGARGGSVISLDPRTGELLALAEQPAFDPNRFRDTRYADTRARAVLDAIEPGSTLKPFLVAAALDARVLDAAEAIDCEDGSYRVPGKTLHDLHPHAELDVAGVLRVSSNIGAVKIGERLTPDATFAALRRLGFGSRTGSGFPEESAGLLRPAGQWQPLDRASIAFGQGIGVTSLQMAAAFAALANEGWWLPPRLVTARRAPGGEWQRLPAAQGRRALGAQAARRVLHMLEGVVGPDGTGRLAGLRALRVAGKTGTAQKLDPETKSYSDERYWAWFAGVVPADAPRLAIVVVLDEPQSAHTGGAAAAPLFARVAAAQLARLGIATEPTLPRQRIATEPALPGERIAAEPALPGQRVAAEPALPGRRVAAEPGEAPPAVSSAPPARLAGNAPSADSEDTAAADARDPAAPLAGDLAAPAPLQVAWLGDRLLLPDFRGLRPEEVRRVTASWSLRMELSGEGRAVAQEPAPGTILSAADARVQVRFADDASGRAGEER